MCFLWIYEREFWITKISIYLINLINSRFLKILYTSNYKLPNDITSELIETFLKLNSRIRLFHVKIKKIHFFAKI